MNVNDVGGVHSSEGEARDQIGRELLIAIDPGEVHCGIARFEGDYLMSTFEMTPDDLFDYLKNVFEYFAKPNADYDSIVVVMESFRLYPGSSKALAYSALMTVEVIGVVRFLCKQAGIKLVEQNATIKIPTRKQMVARGIVNFAVTSGKGRHCADAVEHGYYYLLRDRKS